MEMEAENFIKELDQYIALNKNRLETILTALDWTIEDTFKEKTFTRNNKIKESIDRNDPLLPDSFGCTNSIVIEKPQLQRILNKPNVFVPAKFSDIQLNFTREQKSKIYDYVIANTAKTSEPELKVSLPNDNTDNGMTFAEIVAKAKKKDKKLQRKYRTSKPTHIEEVRNLVHLQMQALEKYFNPEPELESPSYRDRRIDSGKFRYERSQSIEETTRNKYSESRYRKTRDVGHHQSKSDRSRSNDRRHRSKDRTSPTIVQKRKRSRDMRIRNSDEALFDRSKKLRKRSKSPKSDKKYKHHRNH